MPVSIGAIEGLIKLRDEFSSQLDIATKNLEKSGKKFERLGRDISDVGSKLTTSISLPLIAIGGLSVKAASDFESSFAGIRKTVNATSEQFSQLSGEIRQLSKEIPINVNELNRIGESAGQLGIKTENLLDFTRVMADLGVTTNLSSDQAASSLARLANITQMPQENFDRLGSTIVALGNNFATTEAEIVEMSLRIAGAGKQIGLTEGEILAIGTSLSSVGIAAEAGGSAISKIMIEIALAVSKGGKELENFATISGMSSAQFQKAFRDDAAQAINSFITGLGKIQQSGGDVLSILDKIGITEVRMRDAILRSAGAGDILTRALDLQSKAWSENTALTKEAEERYKTFESQLTLLRNKVNDIAITFGEALIPSILSIIDAAEPLLSILTELVQLYGSLSGEAQLVIFSLGAVAAAVGPVAFVTGQLITTWGVIISTAPGVAAALKLVSSAALGTPALIIGGLLLINEVIKGWGRASEEAIKYHVQANKANEITFQLNQAKINGGVLDSNTWKVAEENVSRITARIKELNDEINNEGIDLFILNPERRAEIGRLERELANVRQGMKGLIVVSKESVQGMRELIKLTDVELVAALKNLGITITNMRNMEQLDAAISALDELLKTETEGVKILDDSAEQLAKKWSTLLSQSNALREAALRGAPAYEALARHFQAVNEAAEAGAPHLAELGKQALIAAERVDIALQKSSLQLTIAQLRVAIELGKNFWEVMEGRDIGDLPSAPIGDMAIPELPLPTEDDWRELEKGAKKWGIAMGEMSAVTKRAWENIQDAITSSIANIIKTGKLNFKDLADTIINIFANMLAELLIKWAVNAAKRIAMEQAVAASSGSGIMGPTQSGGNIAGVGTGNSGGMFGASWGSIFAVGSIVAIVGAIGLAMGWWGSTGPTTGQVSFGGGPSGDLSITGATGENAKVIQKRLREALKSIGDLLVDLDLEISNFNEVIVRKVEKTYEITGTSLIRLTNATSEEINEAIRVMTIRSADFGKSVSDFLKAIIRGSRAITEEQLRAEIELGRMVENFGKSDTVQQISKIGKDIDSVFRELVRLLSHNLEQLNVGLMSTVREELTRWEDMFRQLTGQELSPEERLNIMKSEAAIFNAEKALRIADLEARLAQLKAEKALANLRQQLGLDELKGKGRLLNIELGLQREFFKAAGDIVQAAATALDLQIAAIEQLLSGLAQIPDIDISAIKLPNVGNIGGAIDQKTQDLQRLQSLLDAAASLGLSEYAAALKAINDKWDEAIILAHGNVDLLNQIADARQREIELLNEQRRLTFTESVGNFLTGGSTGSPLLDAFKAVDDQVNSLGADLNQLAQDLGLSAHEMLHWWQLILARAEELRKKLAIKGLADLAGNMAGMVKDQQLRHDLLMVQAQIEFDLRLAQYQMEIEMLTALGYLTQEQIDLLNRGLKDLQENRQIIIEGMVPPIVPVGGGSDGGIDPQDEIARAMEKLRDIQARMLDPFSQAIRSVVDEFAELRSVLGWTIEVQTTYAQEIQRVLTEQLEPIRRLQEEMNLRSDAPLRTIDQFKLAQQRLNDAVASLHAGDLSQVQKIPDLARMVLDLIPSSGASEGRRFIFERIKAILQEAENAAKDAVTGIVPGTSSDPWLWLRDNLTAGDRHIADTITHAAKMLGDKQDETTNNTGEMSRRMVSRELDTIDNLRGIREDIRNRFERSAADIERERLTVELLDKIAYESEAIRVNTGNLSKAGVRAAY